MDSPPPAKIAVDREPNRAVVTMVGEIGVETVLGLIDSVRRLHRDEYYRDVVLRLSTMGGSDAALEYLIGAMRDWRAEGLRLTTRALTPCASAGAILVSLGDVRVASPGSCLVYHGMRFSEVRDLDRNAARARLEHLEGREASVLVRLAERAVPTPLDGLDLAEDDGAVLKRLAKTVGDPPGGDGAVQWLRRWMDQTGRTEGTERLKRWTRLYAALFVLDEPISGTLARALGLVDRLVGPSEPETVAAEAPAGDSIAVPEWGASYPGGRVPLDCLKRHTLVMGETGSGKTRSAVLPLLDAALKSDAVGVGLVIDPKQELCEEIRGRGPDGPKVVDLKREGVALDLMSSPAWSVREMVEEKRYWSAAEHVLRRVGGLSADNAAGMLLGRQAQHRDAYWPQSGLNLYTAGVALAIEYVANPELFLDLAPSEPDPEPDLDGPAGPGPLLKPKLPLPGEPESDAPGDRPPERTDGGEARNSETDAAEESASDGSVADGSGSESAADGDDDRSEGSRGRERTEAPVEPEGCKPEEWVPVLEVFDAIVRRTGLIGPSAPDGVPNLLAVADLVLSELCSPLRKEDSPVPRYDAYGRRLKPERRENPMQAVARAWNRRTDGPEYDQIGRVLALYSSIRDGGNGGNTHYAGIYGFAAVIGRDFTAPESRTTLYFGVEPRDRIRKRLVDFSRAVRRRNARKGIFYLYSPDNTGADNLVARAFKAAFFEATLNCGRRRGRNARKMPLVAYVADEFQRFITADPVHGEQSFLDVCRSFGGFAVLACQSVASLEYALASLEPDTSKRRAAIDIICNNTATKMFFRSTDPDTSRRVALILPRTGDRPVSARRPLSSLAPGECYAVLPNGRAGRFQIDEYGTEEENR